MAFLNRVLSIISYFQMNFQQHRNFTSYTHLPPYNQPFSLAQTMTSNQGSQLYCQRQPSNRSNIIKPPFNLKQQTFQSKQFYRPQQALPNAPLTFNMQSPTKSKVKKTNRPASRVGNKSFVNPFTKQLEDEFFKNESNQLKPTLDDFSKTTSTINGHSILNQHALTEPHQQRNYTSLKPYQEPQSFTAVQHSNSLKILFQRKESQIKHYPQNQLYHNHSGYLLHHSDSKPREAPFFHDQRSLMDQINRQKQQIQRSQNFIIRLNQEIKNLKQAQSKKQEKDLRGSINENTVEKKQLEFQLQQNNKLLTQIQSMENDIKQKIKLNRYLEHQCNHYNDSYQQIKKQFENYKAHQIDESTKQEELINALKKKVSDLQYEADYLKATDKSKKDEIVHLKKTLQLQGEKLEELSTNNEIDKSEINVLTKKLQNFQIKYEKLMHSHCETELKHNQIYQKMKIERKNWQETVIKHQRDQQILQQKYRILQEEKDDIYIQLTVSKGELIKTSNQREELKSLYQRQFQSTKAKLNEFNRQIQLKTQQNEKLTKSIQQRQSLIEQLQNSLKISSKKQQQLSLKAEESVKLAKRLSDKQTLYNELSEKKSSLELDYSKVSVMHLQTTSIVESYASQLEQLRQSAAKIQLHNTQINKKYENLKLNFQLQSTRYKQVQAQLIQNQFDYNMLQKEFTEYSLKYNNIQEENSWLKHRNKALQEQLKTVQQEKVREIQRLQDEIRELTQKYVCAQSQNQRTNATYQEIQQKYLVAIDQIQLKNLSLSQKSETINQITQNHGRKYDQLKRQFQLIVEKFVSLQSKYASIKQSYQKLQKAHKAVLQQNSRYLQGQQQSSEQLLLVERLQSTISSLKQNLQQQLQKTVKGQQLQRNLQQQIASLLHIIDQNEKRYEANNKQLLKKINQIDNQKRCLQQQFEQQGLQNKQNIQNLKQLITKLTQQIETSIDPQTYSSNPLKQQNLKQNNSSLRLKQWNSFSQLHSLEQSDSDLSVKRIQSAQFIQQADIGYIEMDREGINYLCQLLDIELSSGNILNQIVVKVQNNLNQISLSRKTVQSYRKVLDAFGVQESIGSYESLIHEITTFKQNISLLIEQLKQEQNNHQALKIQNQNIRAICQAEQLKTGRTLHELYVVNNLNHELNEIIVNMTAKMCNQRFIMMETINLARINSSQTSIRSQKFVTVKSLDDQSNSSDLQLLEGV